MRPLKRFSVSKSGSARGFRSNVGRTHKKNLNVGLARGGIRL